MIAEYADRLFPNQDRDLLRAMEKENPGQLPETVRCKVRDQAVALHHGALEGTIELGPVDESGKQSFKQTIDRGVLI